MRFRALYSVLTATVLAAGLATPQATHAAPSTTEADKQDMACIILVSKTREQMMQASMDAQKKQMGLENLALMVGFFTGKLAVKHPEQPWTAIAKGVDFKGPAAAKYFDVNRCTSEVRSKSPR